jgi:hypothetical protein
MYDKTKDGEKMLVGLISDTHDNLPMIEKAVERLNKENVELILHAGDYIAPFTVPRFQKLKARLIGVFGNNDGDRELLKKRFSENERLELRGNFAKIDVDGLKICLLHGDERELLDTVIESQNFDFVVHGHTHEAEVYRNDRTLIVNPGEVCGYLTGKSSIALLDTVKKEARVIYL